MEKSPNRKIEDFPPARLYLDDLSEIIGILAQACKAVEIRSGDYTIVDPAELDLLASKFPSGRFGHIHIRGKEPHISLDFYTFGINAYVGDESFEQLGIVAKIRDVIKREAKKDRMPAYVIAMYLFVGLAVWQYYTKEYLIGTLLLVVSVASIPASFRSSFKNTLIVYSKRRGEIKNFFERKRDEIFLAVISATLGGAVGYLVTRLTK